MAWRSLALIPFLPKQRQAGSASHFFLGVYDIPASATGNYTIVAEPQQVSDVREALKEVEKHGQDARSIRVYIDEVGVNTDFQRRLQEHLHRCFGIKTSNNEYSTGFHAAMSLWGPDTNQNRWYVVEGIEFNTRGHFSSSGDLWESFGEEVPFKLLVEDFREMLQGPQPIWASNMRRVRFHEVSSAQITGWSQFPSIYLRS